MKVSTGLTALLAASALIVAGSASTRAPIEDQVARLAAQADTDVIVIMRDQLPGVPAARGAALAARGAALAQHHAPVASELRSAGAVRMHSFKLINAIAARIPKSQLARISAHPMVSAVVPDRVIPAPRRALGRNGRQLLDVGGAAAGGTSSAGAAPGGSSALCNTLEPEALQVTNTAFLDPNRPQAQRVRDGNGHYVTGEGVKVAYIADGLDPTIAGFHHADGSPVFIDYQDFTGDPAGTPTDGAEAFGDASSIAANDVVNGKVLKYDISQFVSAAHALPSPCNVRIRGMAPGASLVGLNVFSSLGFTTNSTFVQAIDHAVEVADVDIINESFGGNPLPDLGNDPISLANIAAVNAGITVVVSTGDAGTAGTLGSPSTLPQVIAAGGSTTFRLYEQVGYGGTPLSGGGVVSNNISSLSSGGFAFDKARAVDVVAPGDLGWALCSTNQALYFGCGTIPGKPTPILDFGGTSESSPLTAGAAALIIQAYRSTHGGHTPAPALVKRILQSTARDLGAPAFEQGAGLIDALAAVNMALSVDDAHGKPAPRGNSVLVDKGSQQVTALPNDTQSVSLRLTNTGTTTQHLRPHLTALGPAFAGESLFVTLDPAHDPTFPGVSGSPRSYVLQTFDVPAGAAHLDAAIAFQTPSASSATPIAYLALIDPEGRQAAYSLPQGFGSGYGHVDVVHPKSGTWTAAIWTRPSGPLSYAGPVQFTWSAERYQTFGRVSPATVDLAPGASTTITASFRMPDSPGDVSAGLRFGGGNAAHESLPLSLRTLIPITPTGADFGGTLTGGNGRAGTGPASTYAFDLPPGVPNLSLNLQIADSGYALEGLLVDPNGMQLSVQPNTDPTGAGPLNSLQLLHANPQPGRWRFILLQNFTSSGNQTSLPFNARIGFYGTGKAVQAQVPDDPGVKLHAGVPVTIPVQVTNVGSITQAFFIDGRLKDRAVVFLPVIPAFSTGGPNPQPILALQGYAGLTFVPPEAHSVTFLAQSTQPIQMDAINVAGTNVGTTFAPDLWAKSVGNGAVAASLTRPEVPWGPWLIAPSLIGPFGPGGVATNVPVASAAAALMQPFDSNVTSDRGNAWADLVQGTNTFAPLLLGPGESGTIQVTVKPDTSQIGQTVRGYLYLDTYNQVVSTGDEVARVPYAYSVVP